MVNNIFTSALLGVPVAQESSIISRIVTIVRKLPLNRITQTIVLSSRNGPGAL